MDENIIEKIDNFVKEFKNFEFIERFKCKLNNNCLKYIPKFIITKKLTDFMFEAREN